MQKKYFQQLIYRLLTIALFFMLLAPFYLDNGAQAQRVYGQTNEVTQCPTNGLNNLINPPSASTGGGGISYNPDVACTCRIDQCRLSTAADSLGNQSTASLFTSLSFICVDGATNPSYSLGQEGSSFTETLRPFTDVSYYSTVLRDRDGATLRNSLNSLCPSGTGISRVENNEVVCVPIGGGGTNATRVPIPDDLFNQGGGIHYLDIFAVDTSRQLIPSGSTCRINPNDPGGVASWYYPGYFDVMRGIQPGAPGSSNGNAFLGGVCGSLYNNGEVLFASVDLFGNEVGGTQTFFGCLPNSLPGLTAFIVRLASGLGIIITFLIILINLIQVISNSTNSDAVAEYRKKMQSAIFTLVGLLLSITILSILGIQIIGFGNDGIGGGLFRFFVGG